MTETGLITATTTRKGEALEKEWLVVAEAEPPLPPEPLNGKEGLLFPGLTALTDAFTHAIVIRKQPLETALKGTLAEISALAKTLGVKPQEIESLVLGGLGERLTQIRALATGDITPERLTLLRETARSDIGTTFAAIKLKREQPIPLSVTAAAPSLQPAAI